ncbi:MAG: twin-arginine translocase subunit TatC [Opitutaceae bacterium]
MSEPKDYIEITPNSPTHSPGEKAMSFWGHLEELRGTLIKCAITFVVFAVLIGYFMKEFNDQLMWPMIKVQAEYPDLDLKLGTQSIMEVFNMIIQMCVMGSLALSAPFMLFFAGQFVAPALSEKEKRAVVPLCFSAFVLFMIGASIGFFLLMPNTIRISIQLTNVFEYAFRWTVGSYFTTLTWLVVGVGGTFEFPLIIVLLVWLGITSTAFLRKYRRHAVVAVFIVAAIVTPTADPVNQTILAVMLYLLYEIAIIASLRIEKRKKAL